MQCTNCGAEAPTGAKFCPGCGHAVTAPVAAPSQPPRRSDTVKGLATLAGLIIIGIVAVDGCSGPSEEKTAAASANAVAASAEAADRRRRGGHCIDDVRGNDSLTEQVVAQLRDPKSFEHDETVIGPVTEATEGKHPITMRYRARNGFGGMNVETAVGLVDPATCKAELVIAGVPDAG